MAQTTIMTKQGKMQFLTQQYECGCYCIINNDPAQQFGVDDTEEGFHKRILRTALRMKDEVLSTTYAELLEQLQKKHTRKLKE